MTQLTNQMPESTYGDLLTTTNGGQGLPAVVPVPLQDGLGNNSPITMSQTVFNIDRGFVNQFQLDGQEVLAGATNLNNTINLYLGLFLAVTDTAYNTIATFTLSAYNPGLDHNIFIQFNLFAYNPTQTACACLESPASFCAIQTAGGIILGGSTSEELAGNLNTPNFRVIVSGNNILLQVQELNSNVVPTIWSLRYDILGQE